jgi:hypothetical protein
MIEIVQKQLRYTAPEIGRFLQAHLPSIGGDNWWESHVFNQLTYGQQGQVRTRGIKSLDGLDLAGLLKVFDRNWGELSHHAKLPSEVRSYSKEVADIRHAVSHFASEGVEIAPPEGYRYFDTLERFLMAIAGGDHAVKSIREAKQQALMQMAAGLQPQKVETTNSKDEAAADQSNEPIPSADSSQNDILAALVENLNPHSENQESQDQLEVFPAKKTIAKKAPTKKAAVRPSKAVIAPVSRPAITARNPATIESGKGLKTIPVGKYNLIGPGESIATEIASFDGRPVAATAIPWVVKGPNSHEFLIHVVLIDEDGEGEFGQVFCESRMVSPHIWDDIVKRLRVGIRRLEDGQLTMDLRVAVREKDQRASKRVLSLEKINALTHIDVESVLISLGANAVGTRQEITGETNRTREWPCVTFDVNDLVTPAAAFVLTTILPMC